MDEELEARINAAFGEDAILALCMKPEHMEQGPDFEPPLSVKVPCGMCGEMVWAAPSTMELLGREPKAHTICCCCTGMHSMYDFFSGRVPIHAHEYDEDSVICNKCGLKKDLVANDILNQVVGEYLEVKGLAPDSYLGSRGDKQK